MHLLLFTLLTSSHLAVAGGNLSAVTANAVSLTKEFIAMDSTNPPGNESKLAQRLKERLDQANPDRQNLIARLKGNGSKRPMLIMAHSDVVPTAGQPWTTKPHEPTEDGGYLYGRGALDDLSYAAAVAEILVDIKNSGVTLDRDVIFAFTADEERGSVPGMMDVLAHNPELINDAEFALNEGGAVLVDDSGRPSLVAVSNAEKNYMDFKIVVDNAPGGPSWRPLPKNAIAWLSRAVDRVVQVKFPAILSPLTREYFRISATFKAEPMRSAMLAIANSGGQPPLDALDVVARDPILNGSIRTTCVPTMINAGIAPNVLATKAELNVNCRILPGTSVSSVRAALVGAIRQDPELNALFDVPESSRDKKTFMKIVDGETFGQESPESPMQHPVFTEATALAKQMLGGALVFPQLNTGASDSRLTRRIGIPTYGLAPFFIVPADLGRVHNANERLALATFQNGIQYFYALVLRLAGSNRVPSSVAEPLPRATPKQVGKALEELVQHPFCAE
jgi:acetylornithine deacetylase/succinyl-diaminopimelate desuccinylase-like protein